MADKRFVFGVLAGFDNSVVFRSLNSQLYPYHDKEGDIDYNSYVFSCDLLEIGKEYSDNESSSVQFDLYSIEVKDPTTSYTYSLSANNEYSIYSIDIIDLVVETSENESTNITYSVYYFDILNLAVETTINEDVSEIQSSIYSFDIL